MKHLARELRRFLREDAGLTITEYAIAGSLVAASAAVAFMALGGATANTVNEIRTDITG